MSTPSHPLLFLLVLIVGCSATSNPAEFNGGSILAMAGRNAVAIAVDARFGLGMQTVSTMGSSETNHADHGRPNSRVVLLLPHSNALLAWSGLFGDGVTFTEELTRLLASKYRRSRAMAFEDPLSTVSDERKKLSPRAIARFVSHLLYQRRSAGPYFVEPVIVGMETIHVSETEPQSQSQQSTVLHDQLPANDLTNTIALSKTAATMANSSTRIYKKIHKPYLCSTDMLGALSTSTSFVCAGVASRSLHGTAEALWRSNLEAEELVQVCGKAFLSALERDCLSGYGAVVYLIQTCREEGDKEGDNDMDVAISEYVLACRND